MTQTLSSKRVNPRARTASDFDVQKNQYSQQLPVDIWNESSSAGSNGKATNAKGANSFPNSVVYVISTIAILMSGIAIYKLAPTGTDGDDLKNQQYISSLLESIVALKKENASIGNRKITDLQGTIVTLKSEKAQIVSDKNAVCGLLSSAKKSIAIAKNKCDPSTDNICSNLPNITDQTIQNYCAASLN